MAGSTYVQVILRQLDGLLQLLWGLDEGRNETRGHVPLEMAMEEPDSYSRIDWLADWALPE